MWALHENKSLLEGQFAIVLQQISINCGPNSHPGKCQLKWITALSAALSLCASLSRTDDIRPVLLCDGDMCPNIFKCHHPGVWDAWECGDYKYHIWSRTMLIFLTLSPRVSSWACSHWLSAWPGLRWVKPILSSAHGEEELCTNYKARLGHGPRSRLDTSNVAHSQLSSILQEAAPLTRITFQACLSWWPKTIKSVK